MFDPSFQIKKRFFAVFFSAVLFAGGCTAEAAKENSAKAKSEGSSKTSASAEPINLSSKAAIKIEPNSPADTVRVFYQRLREKKFREAMFLTNLRPAIEGLTEAELKELHVDFEPLAQAVPAEIEINGEIISKDLASVTADLPDNETDKMQIQEIKLRRENGAWMILTVDEAAEADVKREGKNYFFALRIKTHQEEAKAMLERVNKAQMVYAMKNDGLYGDVHALIEKGFLPTDILAAETTGYNYQIQLSADKKSYAAIAAPAVYGKTGKLTYWYETKGNKNSVLRNKDTKGQTFKM